MLVSLFKNSTDNLSVVYVKYTSVLKAIKEGNVKESILKIREGKGSKDSIKKKELPAVTFSGTFKLGEVVDTKTGEIKTVSRNIKNLNQYSGLIVIDFDGLSSIKSSIKLKSKLTNDSFVSSCFLSPSLGVKAVFKVTTNNNMHKEAFKQIKEYCELVFGAKVDKSGSDVTRLCYLSYDPDLYYNKNSLPFPVKEFKKEFIQTKRREININNISYDLNHIWNITEKILRKNGEYFVKGNRNEYVHKAACIMNRAGVSYNQIIEAFCRYHSVSNDFYNELCFTIKSACERNKHEFGSKPFEDNRKNINKLF